MCLININNVVNTLSVKNFLVFLDTCHAGHADINGEINKLNERGAVVFASSAGDQISIEDENLKHGLFTLALIEGLNGKADLMGDGEVTISSLDTYVSKRVKNLSKGEQTPQVTIRNISDFPIARTK